MKKQSAGELSRPISGQWTKSEKREKASRDIMQSKLRTKAINKAIKQQQFMK